MTGSLSVSKEDNIMPKVSHAFLLWVIYSDSVQYVNESDNLLLSKGIPLNRYTSQPSKMAINESFLPIPTLSNLFSLIMDWTR